MYRYITAIDFKCIPLYALDTVFLYMPYQLDHYSMFLCQVQPAILSCVNNNKKCNPFLEYLGFKKTLVCPMDENDQ